MALENERLRMIDLIRSNIQKFGRHVYSVRGGESPRFLYTIGLFEKSGAELLFAGGAIFDERAVGSVLNTVARLIEEGADPSQLRIETQALGPVRLIRVDPSWVSKLLLGALDYYDVKDLPTWQIVPIETEKVSIDIPNTAEPYSPTGHPVWRWLDGAWPYDIPRDGVAITDLDMMLGYAASEVMRWESAEWEIYSGEKPEYEEDAYRVPLATLLAFDASLEPAVDLRIGRGMIRDYDDNGRAGPWEPWGPKS